MANIWFEYVEFGLEAFNKNKLQSIIIECEEGIVLARPVYQLILCVICHKECNLGLVKTKIDALGNALTEMLRPLAPHISEENAAA